MAKDYAKSSFSSMRARKKKRLQRRLLLLSVMVVLAVSSILYVTSSGFNSGQIKQWVLNVKQTFSHRKLASANNAADPGKEVAPAEPEVHFNFYTELPNMQVTLPVTQTEPTKSAPPPIDDKKIATAKPFLAGNTKPVESTPAAPEKAAEVSQYVVQVGAYKNNLTASEMRVSMLLAGFDVSVVKSKVEDQTVFRIQQGPFPTMAKAKIAQKKLQDKGYEGMVQKLN